MNTRIFASIILAATVAASAAQAANDSWIDDNYIGTATTAAVDDYGLGSYFVASKREPGCTQYDLNPLSVIYSEQRDVVSDYLAPQAAQVVCLRNTVHG